ncbi:MAG: hypothetical protein MI810_22090, partial [Flavobacteriales bacterium]|nr:hypothetical protein [Flavobacteriales bacterium]
MLRRYRKGIALVLLISFTQEIFGPTTLFALTGGPSQPEVNSFEPVGTNQMVDLSTGDFNYNIPLMVVPGPNGGYPINLAYHAGIGMEQEASWVGLGWNINPGAITRSMRGVPDDFSGDQVKKKVNMKDDITIGVNVNTKQLTGSFKENFGFLAASSLGGADLGVYYNTYRGVGHQISYSPLQLNKQFNKVGYKDTYSIVGNLAINFDSQTGIGLTPSFGMAKSQKDAEGNNAGIGSWTVGVGIHSRQGVQSIFMQYSAHKSFRRYSGSNAYSGPSFINSTYIPATTNSMSGMTVKMGFSGNTVDYFGEFDRAYSIRSHYMKNGLSSNERELDTYGTMYLQNRSDIDLDGKGEEYDQMMDVNVYNDVPISKRSVNMGVPVMTSDIYSISGQG